VRAVEGTGAEVNDADLDLIAVVSRDGNPLIQVAQGRSAQSGHAHTSYRRDRGVR